MSDRTSRSANEDEQVTAAPDKTGSPASSQTEIEVAATYVHGHNSITEEKTEAPVV